MLLNLAKASDEELAARFREKGDNRALEVLFKRHLPYVLGLCNYYLRNPHDAEDASMDIFENVMRGLLAKPVANFRSWLFITARNHCYRLLQNHASWRKLIVDLAENNTGENVQNGNEPTLYEEQVWEWLNSAIEQLDPQQKQCLLLFYFEKKSYQEIADLLKYPVGQVRSHLQNGRRNLRRMSTASSPQDE